MDQYLSQIAPTLMKHMMESNTLRSSNQLQKEQEKAGKSDKAKKAGDGETGVDSGSMTMSDDLFDTSAGSLSYEGFSNSRSWQNEQDELRHRANKGKETIESQGSDPSAPIVDGLLKQEELPNTIIAPEAKNKYVEDQTFSCETEEEVKIEDLRDPVSGNSKVPPQSEADTGWVKQSPEIVENNILEMAGAANKIDVVEVEDDNKLFYPKTIEDRINYLLTRHLILSQNQSLKEKLGKILAVMGERLLAKCNEFGIKVVLVPKGISLASFGLSNLPAEIEGIRAAYIPQYKICVLGEEYVREWSKESFNLPIYLLAHAYDHALGKDSFASGKSPAVLSGFTACRLEQDNHRFMDSYSALSPVHYFAMAVTTYFTEPVDISSPSWAAGRWSYEDLMQSDPLLCQYISHLLALERKR